MGWSKPALNYEEAMGFISRVSRYGSMRNLRQEMESLPNIAKYLKGKPESSDPTRALGKNKWIVEAFLNWMSEDPSHNPYNYDSEILCKFILAELQAMDQALGERSIKALSKSAREHLSIQSNTRAL